MKKILLAFFLFGSYFCNAQNYQCLQYGVKHFFTNGNHYLRGIRIDSVISSGGVSLFYPYQTYRKNTSGTGLYNVGGSWLGKKVIQRPDGTFLFDNIWNDTTVIRTQANLGDTWVFYNDTSSRYYTATVTAVDTATVLTVVDSVKKIIIHAYKSGILDTMNIANNFQITLSKNNGFIKVFDLYTFPYYDPSIGNYYQGNDFYLDYVCSPAPDSSNSEFTIIAYHDPRMSEVYNFNVGDAFAGYYDDEQYRGGVINADYHYDSVVGRNVIDSNHVQYIISHGQDGASYYYDCTWDTLRGGGTWPYSCCRADTMIADTSFLFTVSEMPEEQGYDTLYFFNPGDDTLCYTSTSWKKEYMPSYDAIEPCLLVTIFKDGFPVLYKYDCPNDGCANGFPITSTATDDIFYSSKNSIACGHLPNLSVQNMPPAKNTLQLFPNPAYNELNITATNPITQITITNLLGQTLYTHNYNSEKVQVDVADLPTGIYFMKINGLEVKKFVKE